MNQRPSFGAIVPETKPEVETEKRIEIGAVWQKTTRDNEIFQSIQLKFTKNKLQELLNSSNNEEITVNLVAFPNRRKENSSHPTFRIYEDRKRT